MPQLFLLKLELVLWARRTSTAPLCSLTELVLYGRASFQRGDLLGCILNIGLYGLFALPLPFARCIYNLEAVRPDSNQKRLRKEGNKCHKYYLRPT